MVNWSIATYARIRPSNPGSDIAYSIEYNNVDNQSKKLCIHTLNGRRSYEEEISIFDFDYIFNETDTQENLYDSVCKNLVLSAIHGYNATIFAYGQTGSGKTFTIIGGDTFINRGIIPRSLTTIFNEFKKNSKDKEYRCYVSFMQIYNENVYDLLDREQSKKPLEEWKKVKLLDDNDGELNFKNLNFYETKTEEEALNFLFLGHMNRVTSATTMNQASSRSHAIFTVIIDTNDKASKRRTISKLNLVDLAGSERIYKRKGNARVEGRFINLSLHHLEQVILALQKESIGSSVKSLNTISHIPYRNSLLTSVLRGSLGGNCKSLFIATINPESEYTDETISTCKFMERCKNVTSSIKINEQIDPTQKLKELQMEYQRLQKQYSNMQSSFNIEKTKNLEYEQIIHNLQDRIKFLDEILREQMSKVHDTTESQTDIIRNHSLKERQEFINLLLNSKSEFSINMDSDFSNSDYVYCCISLANQIKDLMNSIKVKDTEILTPMLISDDDYGINLNGFKNISKDSGTTNRLQNESSSSSSSFPRGIQSIEIIETYYQLLKRGNFFMKHGRHGNPHLRFVWFDEDLRSLQYREVGSIKPKATIPIEMIKYVSSGRTSQVFLRALHSTKGNISFSFYLQNGKTLDLEFGDGIVSDVAIKQTKEWVNACNIVLNIKHMK